MHPGRDADTWISVDAFCIALGYGEAEPNTSSPSRIRKYVRAYVESSHAAHRASVALDNNGWKFPFLLGWDRSAHDGCDSRTLTISNLIIGANMQIFGKECWLRANIVGVSDGFGVMFGEGFKFLFVKTPGFSEQQNLSALW